MRFGIPCSCARRRSRRSVRGATLVEYALGVSLLCVASIGGIDAVQSSLEDNIEEHGASAGAPDLPDTGIPTTTATTSAPTTAPPPTTAVPSVTATGDILATRVGAASGNKWSPAVDLAAINSANGQRLSDVTISLTWTYTQNGQTVTSTATPCAAPSTGVCTFQLNGLSSNNGSQCVSSVTFTVTAITSSSQNITYTAGSTTGSIAGPRVCG